MTRHPEWCAQGHRCNLGEHRSYVEEWPTRYGSITATRIRSRSSDWLEVRITARLDRDTNLARDAATRLLVGLDLAVRDALAGRLERLKDQYRRLTGVRVK